jgi:hypothetical protein
MVAIAERSTAAGTDVRRWVGRIIVGVLLGEAIWNLIVSVISNVFVPWLGGVVGQSYELPASFTQRPYDYPDFLVSVLESCIAAIMALILNYLFQWKRAERPISSSVPTMPVVAASLITESSTTAPATEAASPIIPAAPEAAKPSRIAPDLTPPVTVVPPSLVVPLEPAARPSAVAPQGSAVATSPTENSLPQVPKAKTSNPAKRREIYYNSVGEPLTFEEDKT